MQESVYTIIPQLGEDRIEKNIAGEHLHCKRDCTTNYVDVINSVQASFVKNTFHVYIN